MRVVGILASLLAIGATLTSAQFGPGGLGGPVGGLGGPGPVGIGSIGGIGGMGGASGISQLYQQSVASNPYSQVFTTSPVGASVASALQAAGMSAVTPIAMSGLGIAGVGYGSASQGLYGGQQGLYSGSSGLSGLGVGNVGTYSIGAIQPGLAGYGNAGVSPFYTQAVGEAVIPPQQQTVQQPIQQQQQQQQPSMGAIGQQQQPPIAQPGVQWQPDVNQLAQLQLGLTGSLPAGQAAAAAAGTQQPQQHVMPLGYGEPAIGSAAWIAKNQPVINTATNWQIPQQQQQQQVPQQPIMQQQQQAQPAVIPQVGGVQQYTMPTHVMPLAASGVAGGVPILQGIQQQQAAQAAQQVAQQQLNLAGLTPQQQQVALAAQRTLQANPSTLSASQLSQLMGSQLGQLNQQGLTAQQQFTQQQQQQIAAQQQQHMQEQLAALQTQQQLALMQAPFTAQAVQAPAQSTVAASSVVGAGNMPLGQPAFGASRGLAQGNLPRPQHPRIGTATPANPAVGANNAPIDTAAAAAIPDPSAVLPTNPAARLAAIPPVTVQPKPASV